jgi:hypothetical protein
MANNFTVPPQPVTGAQTFSDNLVGLQLVTGGGLTNANFGFTTSTNEKVNRNFITGTFSEPINLDGLGVDSISQSKAIIENNFKVYPNFDLTLVTNFTLYGSMVKRMSSSITTIISYFPAALESTFTGLDYTTGATAENIFYNEVTDETTFDLRVSRLRNPFDIDFTINATRNLSLREVKVSDLRNMTTGYTKYSLYLGSSGFSITNITPTTSSSSGILTLSSQGNPFSGLTTFYDNLVIRPNDSEVNRVFNENLDEVENFLLNRNIIPIYTAQFLTPTQNEDGTYTISTSLLTWPLNGYWNIDIQTGKFTTYLTELNEISEFFDLYQTNLISRFYTTPAFKEFDTPDQKMEKILQIYGRSFDETKKFIDALANMTSVNYNVGADIPSQLLKNLAQTLGWTTNISPISNTTFLDSVFGQTNQNVSQFTGLPTQTTPDQLNYQFYRNLVLNSAYLFKSKGTRKSIEILLRLIGAPEALVEFNEFVYLADQKINLDDFNQQYAQISGGTYTQILPSLDPTNVFRVLGYDYTGFTTSSTSLSVNLTPGEIPMDEFGYPTTPPESEDYFFQIGSGWFEQTPQHRAPEEVDLVNSTFTGNNPNFQTTLIPFNYGQVYLNRFRKFPFMSLGYNLSSIVDNNKSWYDSEVGLRSNNESTFNARYNVEDDKLVLNVKNMDLFMNPAQGIAYDVWYMSNEFNYPIPNQGLNYVPPTYCDPYPYTNYPNRGGVDWTEINPQPQRKTFFEFAQTFWNNTINVRNRLFASNGKTGGYPTLESIFWKYLQSKETINIPNNNFSYETMLDYVQGIGDYWIRMVEQMIPSTTIWNTGTKLENSIFHRQKFVWRRQEGCQIVPFEIPTPNQGGTGVGNPPVITNPNQQTGDDAAAKRLPPTCRSCSASSSVFSYDCPIDAVQCSIYPSEINPQLPDFFAVLGNVLNTYLNGNGYNMNNCDLNSLTTEWFVDVRINSAQVISYSFFNGFGYNNLITSAPSLPAWKNALTFALQDLVNLGYDYYFTNKGRLVVYSLLCPEEEQQFDFKLNVGINFSILCS